MKRQIGKGQVCVNDELARRPELKVDTVEDRIRYCGRDIYYQAFEYYMLNKPAGVISATEDKRERTVIDLITERQRRDLFPVGRLDRDTEGLLLITNDGAMAHRLLSPRKHVDKTYYVKVAGRVTGEDAAAFRNGVDIGDEKKTLPAELRILKSAENSEVELTIREGRFHQVKRMFAERGKTVLYLKRIRMGGLVLDETLKPGEYRRLTEKEMKALC